MTLKQYLTLMALGSILCWLSLFFVMYSGSPEQTTLIGFIFFYLSLFLALVGTISVLGFLILKKLIKRDELVFRHVKKTFRQGIIFSTLIIIFFILAAYDLNTWWNLILLALVGLFVEGIMFANRKHRNVDYV